MDRFFASYIHNIDSKGRVSVPAPFRQVIAERGIRDLFAMRSLGLPVMDVGGPDLLERFERQMDQISPLSQTFQDLSVITYGDGTQLKFDAEGRIAMTDFIRSHTGITDQVAFVGGGHFFRLWEPAKFEAYLTEARARILAAQQSETSRASSRETPE